MVQGGDQIGDRPKPKVPSDMDAEERYREYRERQQVKQEELDSSMIKYTKYQSVIVTMFLFGALLFIFSVYTANIGTGSTNVVIPPISLVFIFIEMGLLSVFFYIDDRLLSDNYMSDE